VKVRYIRNDEVRRVLIGVPRGHRHLRVVVETIDEILVFSEATFSNIVRAFITVLTHPQVKAVELVNRDLRGDRRLKTGYARFQLVESGKADSEVVDEISSILVNLNKENRWINQVERDVPGS